MPSTPRPCGRWSRPAPTSTSPTARATPRCRSRTGAAMSRWRASWRTPVRAETTIRRRDVLAAVGGSLMALLKPGVGFAQDRMRSIGILMARRPDDPEGQRQFDTLMQGLAEAGWVEGRTMRLETRWIVGD